MAGLLDYQFPQQTALDDPRTAGLLRVATGLLQGSGPSRAPVGFGQLLGAAGNEGMAAFNQAQESQVRVLQQQMAMQEAMRKQAELAARQAAIAKLPPDVQQAIASGVPYADIWKRQNPEAKIHDTYDAQGRKVPSIVDVARGTTRPIGAPAPMEAPKFQTFINGDQETQKAWNGQTGQWETVGAGGRWNPKPQNQTTIVMPYEKEFDKEMAKLDAKELGDFRTKAQSAQSMLQSLGRMEALNNQVLSGGGADARLAAANLLQGIGVPLGDPQKVAKSQEFDAIATKMTIESLGGSLGAGFSNADRDFITKTVPQLSQSAAARQALIDFMRSKAQQQIGTYQAAQEYAAKNKGLKGFSPMQSQTSATVEPLPPNAKASDLVKGRVYQTSRGKAKWNGLQFEKVED